MNADEDIRELPCQTVMVFQCAKCLRVLTDSTEVVATCCSLQVLAFKGVQNIVISEGLKEFEMPIHYACADLTCQGCNQNVGWVSHELPPSHSALRGFFCLHVDKIKSFAIGECNIRANGSNAAAALPVEAVQVQETASPAVFQQRIDHLDADIVNIQRILLLHSEQLERLSKAELSPLHCDAANGCL